MTRTSRQIMLAMIAAVSATLGVVLITNPDITRDPRHPDDLQGKIAWLASHPADWLTASAIADRSLDSQMPQRRQIWHMSHELATLLAPRRLNTSAGFVRAGLFHWYELGPGDRTAVLQSATPLMGNPATFGRLYIPLFDLTRDFGYLRRNGPRTSATLAALGELAVTNGRFADYREMREALRRERLREFQARRHAGHPTELVDLLPAPISTGDEPLVLGVLEELDRSPFDPRQISRRIEDLTLYAIRHGLQPLAGLSPLVEAPGILSDVTRARLALALGDVAQASRIELTMAVGGSAEWLPYYLDRARFEAHHGDAALADGYLARAALIVMTDGVLATAAEVAAALGQTKNVTRYRQELAAMAAKPRVWSETCGENEICSKGVARQYVGDEKMLRVTASVVQTDEIAPYLEMYVDDALVAEGEVRDERAFTVAAAPGLHRIEVRLVNSYTRNRIQRRIRLS